MDVASLDRDIEKLIRDELFRNLDNNDFDVIMGDFIALIRIIDVYFNINDPVNLRLFLLRENAQDCINLFLLLFPHINNRHHLKQIRKLDELYTIEDDNTKEHWKKFKFTNIQYGRCKLGKKKDEPIKISPYLYSRDHTTDNFGLLINTIRTMAHRLYVNWKTVFPFTISTYDETQTFLNTVQKMRGILPVRDTISVDANAGLELCTIYELIYAYMFAPIHDGLLWLIRNIWINNTMTQVFVELVKFIDLSLCYRGIIWAHITDRLHNKFKSEWNALLGVTTHFPLVDAITQAFDLYYKNIRSEGKETKYRSLNYKSIAALKAKYGPFYAMQKEYIDEIIATTKTIEHLELYNYFVFCLTNFKTTIYIYMFIDQLNALSVIEEGNHDSDIYDIAMRFDKETNGRDEMGAINNMPHLEMAGQYITPEIIYSHAEFLVTTIDSNKKYVLYSHNWFALNGVQQNEFINKLNGKHADIFTNKIMAFIEKVKYYGGLNHNDPIEIQNAMNNIESNCKYLLPDHIFISGIISGTLSELKVVPVDLKKEDKYFDGYHYLHNIRHEYIKTMDPTNGKFEDYKSSIIRNIEDGNKSHWTSMFALNWVSQLNFFHKYINNRIIYVTGGTGVGKSTQIPKLILYAIKTLDQKQRGKIICSQPRKRPTRDNAIRIANEEGADILSKPKTYGVCHSAIQFRNHDEHYPITELEILGTADKQMIVDSTMLQKHPTLLIVTDKILLDTITNPIYKHRRETGGTDKKTHRKKFDYFAENVYDVVIVDESHEHNQNMDMILTLMNGALHFNNDCKLVIISATMDEDEPIYRVFFSKINDNLMYPLNEYNRANKLDRLHVDRRLNISTTTIFKIQDKYLDFDINQNDEHRRNQITLDIVRKILSQKHGDILIFKSKAREIMDCAKLVNEATPSNICVLPYFGTMDSGVRTFIENVHKDKSSLKISKRANLFSVKSVDELTHGSASYEYIIIIATNIAEASITIDTLTDVIDNGLHKVIAFDPLTNSNRSTIQKISESNRMQRRGRVGRAGIGTIHYLYSKTFLHDAKNYYPMCTSDLTQLLFSNVISEGTKIMFAANKDPISAIILNAMKSDPKAKYDLGSYSEFPGLMQILRKMYYHYNELKELVLWDYIGDVKNNYIYKYYLENDYGLKLPYEQYETGCSFGQLNDPYGSFYIVHPNEIYFTRDMTGRIIDKQVAKSKLDTFFTSLRSMNLTEKADKKTAEMSIVKTPYGTGVEDIYKKLFSIDGEGMQYAALCCFGQHYNCLSSILHIIIHLQDGTNPSPRCKRTDGKSDIISLLNIPLNKNQNVKLKKYKEFINDSWLVDKKGAWEQTNTIQKFLHKENLQDLTLNERVSLSLIHAFGGNIVRRITNTPYYLSFKYPTPYNIYYINSLETCVRGEYLNNYILYIKLISQEHDAIADGKLTMLHYIHPNMIEQISYQIYIEKYLNVLTSESIIADYRIHDMFEYTKRQILRDAIYFYANGRRKRDVFEINEKGDKMFNTNAILKYT